MEKITKRLSMVFVMVVLVVSFIVVSFSIPFMLFPSKVYATSGSDGTYAIGDTGPAGGKIFYVNGSSYLEAAPPSNRDTSGIAWRYYASDWASYPTGATGTAIGTGKDNTEKIIAAINLSNKTFVVPYAANFCNDLEVVNNGVTYNDWFLPSKDEFKQMWDILVGGDGVNEGGTSIYYDAAFFSNLNVSYWTSTIYSENFSGGSSDYPHAYHLSTRIGESGHQRVDNSKMVRAIRAFSVSSGSDSPAASSSPRALTPEEIVALNLTIQQQVDRYGTTNNGFVRMLYDNALGRVYDGGGFGFWTGELAANTMTGSQIAFHFIFSDELAPTINSLSDNEFIAFLYQTLMNRPYDLEGYANWQQHMEAGMTREETVNYFVNSAEFAGICTLFNVTP